MARWNPALHPRDALGRFRPKLASATFYAGKGGRYYGVKAGAEFELPGKGGRVLVKGIVGYAPARGTAAERAVRRVEALPLGKGREARAPTLKGAAQRFAVERTRTAARSAVKATAKPPAVARPMGKRATRKPATRRSRTASAGRRVG